MPVALQMAHSVDPKDALMADLGAVVDDIEPLGAQILVAIYQMPEKTASGIYVPEKSRKENDFQGKVGLVLKAGPTAFMEDDTHVFGERVPEVGDWVMFNVGDTMGFELGKNRCRFIEDVNVKAIVTRPDIIW
jgi:co-chaperonin GroES (HSP10)